MNKVFFIYRCDFGLTRILIDKMYNIGEVCVADVFKTRTRLDGTHGESNKSVVH